MAKEKEIKPTVVARFTREQEAEIFKALAHKPYMEVGKDFGIHLIYPDDNKRVLNTVYSIVQRVRKAPELWGLSPDTVEVVQQSIDRRSLRKNPRIRAEQAIQEESFRDKLDGMRDTVAEIITKKLKKFNTKEGIDEVQLRDLKDLLAMAIDKSRLLKGESTENIKRLSPIDVDKLTPEDALAVVLKAREALVEGKK